MANFTAVVVQIALINVVFSIDSIVTAVGMANEIWVMAVAVILSMIVLMVAAGPVASFVEAQPTVKILALGFLIMIGMTLVDDAFGVHVPKGHIYTAMIFSVFIECINMAQRRRAKPVHLRNPYGEETGGPVPPMIAPTEAVRRKCDDGKRFPRHPLSRRDRFSPQT
jgi:predicted tellurium resistance membrane protein TerC